MFLFINEHGAFNSSRQELIKMFWIEQVQLIREWCKNDLQQREKKNVKQSCHSENLSKPSQQTELQLAVVFALHE